MGRIAADASYRLKVLDAARKAVKKDELLNADEMAIAVKMTWRNLKRLIDEDPEFPVVSRGAEGHAWQFDARAVIDHLAKRYRKMAAARDETERRRARLAGISIPDDAPSGLGVDDYVQINRVQIEVQRRKIEQGEWVRRSDVASLITDFMTMVQAEHLAIDADVDQAGLLPPPVRAAVRERERGILVRLHDRFGAYISNDARSSGRAGRRARASR